MREDKRRDDFDKDLYKGKKYTRVRVIDVFERSRDAMFQETGDLFQQDDKGFYQLVLMLGEVIAHEEMATAFNMMIDLVMDEVYCGLGKTESDAQTFKRELKKSLRGRLDAKALIKDIGMDEAFRKMIREGLRR